MSKKPTSTQRAISKEMLISTPGWKYEALEAAQKLVEQSRFKQIMTDSGITEMGEPVAAFALVALYEVATSFKAKNNPWDVRDLVIRLAGSIASELASQNTTIKSPDKGPSLTKALTRSLKTKKKSGS